MTSQNANDLVAHVDACPTCGERDPDCLVWSDDEQHVTCQSCGTVYVPDCVPLE